MAEETQKEKGKRYLSIRWKMIIAFLAVFVVVFAAVYYGLYRVALSNANDEIERQLAVIAEYAASGISGDAHDSLYEDAAVADGPFAYEANRNPEFADDPAAAEAAREQPYFGIDDPRYQEIVDWLVSVRESRGKIAIVEDPCVETFHQVTAQNLPGCVGSMFRPPVNEADMAKEWRISLYTYVFAKDSADVVDFVATSEDPASDPSIPGAGFREPYPAASDELQKGITDANVATEPFPDNFGEWYSAFHPIYDSSGKPVGAVGVDMRVTTIYQLRLNILKSMLVTFPIALVVMAALVFAISVTISRPIIQLTASAELAAQGKYEEALAPDFDPFIRDETYTLSEVFELMIDKVWEREQKLQARVQELEILIDEGKKVQQVQEIVESEFFIDLKEKAAEMRGRAKKQTTGVKKKTTTTKVKSEGKEKSKANE